MFITRHRMAEIIDREYNRQSMTGIKSQLTFLNIKDYMNMESPKTLKFEDLKVGQILQSSNVKHSVVYVGLDIFVLKRIETGHEQGYHSSFLKYFDHFVEPKKVKAYLYFILDKRLVGSDSRPSHRLCYDRGDAEIERKNNEKNFFMSDLITVEIEIPLVG